MNTRKCKRTPYLIQARRVAKSPYGSTRRVRAVYAKYKAGQSIGFTARSSLKSMGLVPRADGCYVLGDKYAQ